MKSNVIQEKSYSFALRIVKYYHVFVKQRGERNLARQLLRSGTSIGANVEEAIGGQSDKDFLSKISIAYKEARETKYWLRLLRDSDMISNTIAESLLEDCEEILKIIGSIQTTMKSKIHNS